MSNWPAWALSWSRRALPGWKWCCSARGARTAAASRAFLPAKPAGVVGYGSRAAGGRERPAQSDRRCRRAEPGSCHPGNHQPREPAAGNPGAAGAGDARALRGFEADLEVARAQEQARTRRTRETEAENESANRATIQLNQLTAEAEASRGLLNSFLEGANQTWAGADVYDPDARILSPATVPQEASYPPRARLLLTGVATVLAAAVVAVLFSTRPTMTRSTSSAHGVPVLGLVPLTQRLTRYLLQRQSGLSSAPGSSEVIEKPWSPFSEAVQSIYTLAPHLPHLRPPACRGPRHLGGAGGRRRAWPCRWGASRPARASACC